jgi:hypothetical protein
MKHKILFLTILCITASASILHSQWNQVVIDPPSNIFSISQFDNVIYAGGDSILYYSTDGGINWQSSAKIESLEFGISSIQKWNNKLYVGTFGKGIFESTDNGANWTARNTGLNNSGALEISSIAIRGDSLYAATIGEGVFVLNLLNPTGWQNFRNGLPFGVAWNVYSIYNFNGTLICGAGGNADVYFNINGTDSWIEKSFDLPAAEPNAMISIASYGDTLIGVSYFGIYRSQNNGDSWEYFNPGIGLISFASVTVVNDVLFAIISKLPRSYFISSINSGESWEFEFEFNTMAFSTLYYNGNLFTGRSNGIYWLPYTPSNIDDDMVAKDFVLYQNYPNPFNPITNIQFRIPNSEFICLKVYDVIGNEIITLVDEYKSAGSYEVEFSGEGLSSGVYFFRLQTGSYTETKKMVLLR